MIALALRPMPQIALNNMIGSFDRVCIVSANPNHNLKSEMYSQA